MIPTAYVMHKDICTTPVHTILRKLSVAIASVLQYTCFRYYVLW